MSNTHTLHMDLPATIPAIIQEDMRSKALRSQTAQVEGVAPDLLERLNRVHFSRFIDRKIHIDTQVPNLYWMFYEKTKTFYIFGPLFCYAYRPFSENSVEGQLYSGYDLLIHASDRAKVAYHLVTPGSIMYFLVIPFAVSILPWETMRKMDEDSGGLPF